MEPSEIAIGKFRGYGQSHRYVFGEPGSKTGGEGEFMNNTPCPYCKTYWTFSGNMDSMRGKIPYHFPYRGYSPCELYLRVGRAWDGPEIIRGNNFNLVTQGFQRGPGILKCPDDTVHLWFPGIRSDQYSQRDLLQRSGY